MVVRLGLDGERLALDERDDPGVADECRAHELGPDPLGGVPELTQQRGDLDTVERDRRARNVLWAQCSLHVWASVSSSTSVGSRPRAAKWSRMTRQLGGIERQRSCRVDGGEARVVEAADFDDLGECGVARAGMEDRLDAMRRPTLDHRVGDHPAHQRVDRGAVAARRELDAPSGRGRRHRHVELRRGVDDGIGGDVGDAGVEGDLDGVGRRRRARPTWPSAGSGSARKPARRRRSSSFNSPSTKAMSRTATGPGSSRWMAAAAAAMALPRGSSPIVEMVSRDPAGTVPTLQRRSEDVPGSDAASIAWSPWPTKNARRRPGSC